MFGHDDQQPTATDAPTDAGMPGAPGVTAAPDLASPPSNQPATDSAATDAPSASLGTLADGVGTDELLNIKQDALKQLSPLVSHLDQSPEEKFRTTMMMIQAADDQSLIKDAYEAAQNISDEKARAQALLDIINEINYFTQQHSS